MFVACLTAQRHCSTLGLISVFCKIILYMFVGDCNFVITIVLKLWAISYCMYESTESVTFGKFHPGDLFVKYSSLEGTSCLPFATSSSSSCLAFWGSPESLLRPALCWCPSLGSRLDRSRRAAHRTSVAAAADGAGAGGGYVDGVGGAEGGGVESAAHSAQSLGPPPPHRTCRYRLEEGETGKVILLFVFIIIASETKRLMMAS